MTRLRCFGSNDKISSSFFVYFTHMNTNFLKDKYAIISGLISIICIIAILIINQEIARRYQSLDGKTQAFFGIIELTTFGYLYCFIIPGIIALILGIKSFLKKETRWKAIFATAIACFAVAIVFMRIWRLMI